jgi:magnesium transporter
VFKKKHPPIGARPGTLVIADDAAETRVQFVRYSQQHVQRGTATSIDDLPSDLQPDEKIWVDVQGFADVDLLAKIFDRFEIHPLAAEDLINVPQAPKSESYPGQLLTIVKIVDVCEKGEIRISQIGGILGQQFLLTFHPEHVDILEPVHQRLQITSSRLRQNQIDYLGYVLLDTAVDTYYPVLDVLADWVDDLETRTLSDPRPELLLEIHQMKNRLSNLRRSIWPQRETFQNLIRDNNELISESVGFYLRDTADHCIQATDVVEMYRDRSTGLLSTYISAAAHRSNEIMKFLTVMSSIFVPLTFVAGIYGMNFPHMPEFNWPQAYYVFWVLIVMIAASMFGFFLRRGWIRPFTLETTNSPSRQDHLRAPTHSRLILLDRNKKKTRENSGADQAA